MGLRLSTALVVALLLPACGGEPTPGRFGIQRLDLRLQGGAPFADTLPTADLEVRAWRPSGEAPLESLAPWRPVNCVGRLEDEGGLTVRAARYAPQEGLDHAWWVLEGPLEASAWDALELAGSWSAGTEAVLFWVLEGEEEPHRLGLPVDPSTTVARFDLATQPAWRGRVREVRLYPAGGGPQAYSIASLRTLRSGFRPGVDPSSQFGTPAADSGLLGFGGDLRRTVVAACGTALEASFEGVPSARLVLDIGAPRGLGGASDPWRLAARVVDSGGSEVLSFEKIAGLTESGSSRWARFEEALPAVRPGETYRIELTVDGEGAAAGTPVWLGAPHVLGALPEGGRPDVLLVTLDTLRADALGAGTPELSAFLDSSLAFADAWSACNSTLPSHASILTGLSVPAHGVQDNRSRLGDPVRTLAQAFAAQGYRTAAAVSVHHLEAAYSGLGRGFDLYHRVRRGAVVDGALTLEAVERWLGEEEGDAPLFLWVHLFDPHTPYGPPEEFLAAYEADHPPPPRDAVPASIAPNQSTKPGGFLEGVSNLRYAEHLYRAGVAYTDGLFGRLLRAFDARAGRGGTGAVAVTSDHGEALGERGIWFNHLLCYPEVLRVPLALRFPGAAPARVPARASTLDLAPTLIEELRLGEVGALPGANLLDLAAGRLPGDRRVHFVHSALLQAGCRGDREHYVRTLRPWDQLGPERVLPEGHEVLFDPREDPGLERDLAPAGGARVEELRAAVARWLQESSTGTRVQATVSDDEEARLQALGYGGAEVSPGPGEH